MTAEQSLTGGKLLFSPNPFGAFVRVIWRFAPSGGAPAPSNALSRECGALPHTPLPFGSQKEAKSNFAAQRVKGDCSTYYNFPEAKIQ